MKKGIVFLIVFLMVISFPICGYAKGKEKIYLDSSWKYADCNLTEYMTKRTF